MITYLCTVCKQTFPEDKADRDKDGNQRCPICGAPISRCKPVEEESE